MRLSCASKARSMLSSISVGSFQFVFLAIRTLKDSALSF
jgi:hypothetical protein